MKLSLQSWLGCALVGTLLMAMCLGCASGRSGGRLFTNRAPTTEPAHYVGNGVDLPSQQGARPASVAMPSTGRYDGQSLQEVRASRNSAWGNSGGACFT